MTTPLLLESRCREKDLSASHLSGKISQEIPLGEVRRESKKWISHQQLPENWTDTRETLLEGMLFSLKYLGMTLVEQPKGEELSAAAVKRIVATAKASGKKLQKVTLKVSPRGIILTDNITNQLIENVSIYRISYCTADKMHDKVFAYIAQSQHNENLECHAFLCTKRKMAQAVTLTVAQAFKVAFEFWQVSKEVVATGNLLDLEETAKAPLSTVSANTTNMDEAPRPQALNNSSVVWELDDGLDEAFSRLAQSRTNPQVLDTGLTAQDIHYAQCLSPVDWDKPDSSGAEQDDLFSF
ncbi:low density lipoprotein receptor adapter protein 1 isoform X4 [Lynx canadensis]|uniref:low density lipoprotein receptor adapter protein 1 isoform X4 n=1 Tax=Lynx canadensis TaxID=61383 RepID=UPI0011B0379D|nr:low density lipoprotein receptor adapter protein 1 isoform X4 [Lynx canadensis]